MGLLSDTASPATPSAKADHSRFVQRIRRRFAAELPLLPSGLPRAPVMRELVGRLVEGGRTLGSALRVARQLVLERLAVLDIEHGAAMEDITLAMSELAETALDIALQHAMAELDARHGPPVDAAGKRIEFWIIGMGKLGGRELNVSSDIDLIYLYEDGGQTHGPLPVSAHEYFSQVARHLYTLIGETTEDGFVFRVDLALRPNGNSGPPVVSLPMLEEYLQAHGREWERFAWLKSRVVAPLDRAQTPPLLSLHAMVNAFVFRRYLDYGVFEGLRQLHRKVREEAQRRAAGRPERANDVKLARGGIREIEFIVQLLLIVRGGQFPEIRTRSTLKALAKLSARGLMRPESAARLAEGYTFLRQLEHRIQYLDDQQTHLLPSFDADLRWIAGSMGLECTSDACELLNLWCETREFVATEFDALLREGQSASVSNGAPCRGCSGASPLIDSDELASRLPEELAECLKVWCAQTKVRLLRDDTKSRLGKLVLRTADAIRDERCSMAAALRFIEWLDPLLRRESYIALLVERAEVHTRLLRLLGGTRWTVRYLMRHPGVIDELADERLLSGRFDATEFTAGLDARYATWHRSGEVDEEALLDTLRRAHHAEVFRTLVRDVEGRISVEQVADDLSALADATLSCTLRWAWWHLRQRHRETPRVAVIGYGKLGGKELGYGSDLDVVFIYDDGDEPDRDRASEVYAAYVRKLIGWLTLHTAAGELFDIDLALRPNGNSGLLVTSIASFEKYQLGRGSNTAWTWEHQALTRSRWCAGDASLIAPFETVRRAVLSATRDVAALQAEVRSMRQKLAAAHPVPEGLFDIKHSPGGMLDAEFAVQFLVLAHSRNHPELQPDVGNIALLQRAEAAGLLPTGIGHAAADAYRDLRRVQHEARLDERSARIAPQAMAAQCSAVQALWHSLLG